MKAAIGCAFLSVSLLGLASCATTDSRNDVAATQVPMTAEERYMAHVERDAFRKGVDLTWVNRPKFTKKEAEALVQE
ncbi:MAG: hypothetical protein H0W24_00295 [Lysobacter sp.]|nr:hypothetical protein [Lysobacter sp.]MDQ3205457.1 hypothetical protein [Pseudomonadota bacterium]